MRQLITHLRMRKNKRVRRRAMDLMIKKANNSNSSKLGKNDVCVFQRLESENLTKGYLAPNTSSSKKRWIADSSRLMPSGSKSTETRC